MNINIEEVWIRIVANEGKTFTQIRGGQFTYEVKGGAIVLSRTNRILSKNEFEKALVFVPIENTVTLQHLQAPSYLYAILTDERIKCNLW